MFKKIGSLLITVLGAALLVYSASRSLDFISLTLPPDRQILAFFGLAALDGGLVAWLLNYLYGAKGSWQRAISMLMILVDFVGAVAMFTLDTVFNTGLSGMTTQLTQEGILSAVIVLSLIIALNIAATVAHHLTDSDTRKKMAEEEAQSQIEDMAIKQIAHSAGSLASELAPQIATDWVQEMRGRYTAALKIPALPAKLPTVETITIPAAASKPKPEPVLAPGNNNHRPL